MLRDTICRMVESTENHLEKDLDRIVEMARDTRDLVRKEGSSSPRVLEKFNAFISEVKEIAKSVPGCEVALTEHLNDEILDVILGYSTLDFSRTIEVGFEDSNLNAVAAGLNMLGQELARDINRRENAEENLRKAKEELEKSNHELESFSYSVAHDLRAPLRTMMGFSGALQEDYGHMLPPEANEYLMRVVNGARKMGMLIDGLLELSRLARREIFKKRVDLSSLGTEIAMELKSSHPERTVNVEIAQNMTAEGDPVLLKAALTNLLSNAWKFTSKKPDAKIVFMVEHQDECPTFYVKDNGAGFDMQYSSKLFGAFQRFIRLLTLREPESV